MMIQVISNLAKTTINLNGHVFRQFAKSFSSLTTSSRPVSELGSQCMQPSLDFTGTSVWSMQQVRYKMRFFFPKPSEIKRITKHGYYKRISTAHGRKIIMQRILKGRHVLSH